MYDVWFKTIKEIKNFFLKTFILKTYLSLS